MKYYLETKTHSLHRSLLKSTKRTYVLQKALFYVYTIATLSAATGNDTKLFHIKTISLNSQFSNYLSLIACILSLFSLTVQNAVL